MTLLLDDACCPGFDPDPDEWLEECETCQRRTAPGGERMMAPPSIIVFGCEYWIPPD